jgi:hypothetical protein
MLETEVGRRGCCPRGVAKTCFDAMIADQGGVAAAVASTSAS